MNEVEQLLTSVGTGQRISSSPYDTAWLIRLGELAPDLSEPALEWLLAHQLPDGSWGTDKLCYYHDRVICTLAACAALSKSSAPGTLACNAFERGIAILPAYLKKLDADGSGATIGFTVVASRLATDLMLNLERRVSNWHEALSHGTIRLQGLVTRETTLAYSAEALAAGRIDLNIILEPNGSCNTSPAATAWLALISEALRPKALDYLRDRVVDGAVPCVSPINIFETAWTLHNLSLAAYDMVALAPRLLQWLSEIWAQQSQGVGWWSGLAYADSDDTAMTASVLLAAGHPLDVQRVLQPFEYAEGFHCFHGESNASTSTHGHIIGALKAAGAPLSHSMVDKCLRFLRLHKRQARWFDKWHASPFYATGQIVSACSGYAESIIDAGDSAGNTIDWLLSEQQPSGGWGWFGDPTAEETAYSLQSLVAWHRRTWDNHSTLTHAAIRKGAAWLRDHSEPPYPPMWIGKCLYCPEMVVRSAVLSALKLAEDC